MGGAVKDIGGDLVSISTGGLVPRQAFGGNMPSGPGAPAPTNPQASYLARPRESGRSEGSARDKLEEEKRRRYQAYANTLLGSAGQQAIGDPTPAPTGEPDIAGGY